MEVLLQKNAQSKSKSKSRSFGSVLDGEVREIFALHCDVYKRGFACRGIKWLRRERRRA